MALSTRTYARPMKANSVLPCSSTRVRSIRPHSTVSRTHSIPQLSIRTSYDELSRNVRVACIPVAVSPNSAKLPPPGQDCDQINIVYKFGGSSVRDAERMREVADIITSFPQYLPAVVLSAMGKTTNMLLECGDLALVTPTAQISDLEPLRALRRLHLKTCQELGVESAVMAEVEVMIGELTQLLVGISIMQDLTPRAKDSLVSFGERLSTRIFASFLRGMGVPAKQHDAFKIGVTTTDEFTNADVLYEIKESLTIPKGGLKEVRIITGFLGRGANTGAVTTLGRGGSDLSATVIGAALGLDEVQVWKDVDGVLTSDPRSVTNTRPVNHLTYEEATELAYFGAQVLHPQAMQPAIKTGNMCVRVKNSYNRSAPGSVISSKRDMSGVLVTSIVLKSNVTLVDIVSTRMTGQFGFLSEVFAAFKANEISVDVVATSEVSVSVTLDPKRLKDKETDLDKLKETLGSKLATVTFKRGLAIVSLICNVERTSEILQRTFSVLQRASVKVQMMSQGASKTNISLVINQSEAPTVIQALHDEFFGELEEKELEELEEGEGSYWRRRAANGTAREA
eukprot:gene12551-15773_t